MTTNEYRMVATFGPGECGMSYEPGWHIHYHRVTTGRDHCPALSISNDMPESGGGGGVTDGVEVAASDDDDGGDDDGEPARETLLKNPTPSGKHRNVTATAGALSNLQSSEIALLRLPSVLARIPVSRSGWWAGVKTGRYPQPIRISPRCVAWRSSDIHALIASF